MDGCGVLRSSRLIPLYLRVASNINSSSGKNDSGSTLCDVSQCCLILTADCQSCGTKTLHTYCYHSPLDRVVWPSHGLSQPMHTTPARQDLSLSPRAKLWFEEVMSSTRIGLGKTLKQKVEAPKEAVGATKAWRRLTSAEFQMLLALPT